MKKLILGLTLSLVLIATPAMALRKRGFYADCYTWNPTVCGSGGECITYTCDQCDYYVDDEYIGSDYACY